MKENRVTMKLHPQFKSRFKIEAEKNNMDMIEFSKMLANDEEIWSQVKLKKCRGGDFYFKI